ncbi:tRNA-dihydrouridine synthase B [Actinobacillus pleuropneumoniae]|nr:tRNA-dihydrouridine synthase B [Actinobacillus pleuropneumoniae]
MAGSALLREPELVAQILDAVVNAVDVPVTLKIRTGWDQENRKLFGDCKNCRKGRYLRFNDSRSYGVIAFLKVMPNTTVLKPLKTSGFYSDYC